MLFYCCVGLGSRLLLHLRLDLVKTWNARPIMPTGGWRIRGRPQAKFLDDGRAMVLICRIGSDFHLGNVDGSVCEQRLWLDEEPLRSNNDSWLSNVVGGVVTIEKNHTGHPARRRMNKRTKIIAGAGTQRVVHELAAPPCQGSGAGENESGL